MDKNFVKKRLWNRSISVKDMSAIDPNLPYDLIVNEEKKVKVLTYTKRLGLLDLEPTGFDILAIVFPDETWSRIFYKKSGRRLEEIRMEIVTHELLKKHFTTKIRELINHPTKR